MGSETVASGYLGALVAVVFFGSCYVPAKTYPTYDGIIFQWFMCSGILLVGLVWGLVSNHWSQYAEAGLYTFPEGILGGALFALANLLIPTVVNNVGLGLGFMLWNATNITLGYVISRFGLLGVAPTVPAEPTLSGVGIGLMLASIAVYGMIRPTLVIDKSPTHNGHKAWTPTSTMSDASERSPLLPTTGNDNGRRSTASLLFRHQASGTLTTCTTDESLREALVHPELPNFGPFMLPPEVSEHVALVDATAEGRRKLIGMLVALLVGAFLSGCLVPFANWQQRCRPSQVPEAPILATCDPLVFVFSQCLGIYLASTVAFLLYSLLHRFVLRRPMPRSVMRPAYVCGVLWAIGLMGQLHAMGNLGFDQAYPICSIGPAMISMLWSAAYFKEIQGPRNQRILAAATTMVCAGTWLRVISQ